MIRVAFLTVDLEIGGAQRLIEWTAPRLRRRGIEAEVIVLRGEGPLGRELAAAGVPIRPLGIRRRGDPRMFPRLLAELRRFRPHILHTHLAAANVIGRLAGRMAGVPRILSTVHTMEGAAWHFPMERLTGWMSDAIGFVSQAVADHARRRAGLRGAVERYGAPVPFLTRMPRESPPVIIAAARLVSGKGIDDLLRAAARLKSEAVVRVLGDGPDLERLLALARDLGVGDRVEFAGWCRDVPGALAVAAVAVFPSRLGEGFPLSILEAMMAAVPVVASKTPAVRELIDPGLTGWLYPPGDVGALARRLDGVLLDPISARAVAARARQRAIREFDIEAAVDRLAAEYARRVRPDRAAPPRLRLRGSPASVS